MPCRLLSFLRPGVTKAKVTPLVWLTLALLGGLYSYGLGKVHLFDWDEVNFAECAREMRLTGEYRYAQIGFLPFWEKPPLFFALQALSMSLWGENEVGARFVNVVVTLLTLGVLYALGRRWHNGVFGWRWLFFYGTALLPSFYARSGLIDPLFNLFMLLAAVSGLAALEGERPWVAAGGCGLWMSLAVLTKGPVGVGLPALALLTYGLLRRAWQRIFVLGVGSSAVVGLLVGGWLMLLVKGGKGNLLADFWAYQWRLFSTPDAGHGGPWYYHLVVWAVGLFPASVWAIAGLRRLSFWQLPSGGQLVLILSLWTLVIFSVVKTKILHYSSLGYFGVTYLAALSWSARQRPWVVVGLGMLGLGLLTAGLSVLMTRVTWVMSWVSDPFARAALESKPVVWTGWEGWPGLLLLAGVGGLFLSSWRASRLFWLMGLLFQLWVAVTLFVFAPRAEAYSQGPLVGFCETLAARGAIVWPLGFKSYVPYFYGRMQPAYSPGAWASVAAFEAALLRGEVGRPVYFVSRVDRYEPYLETHGLRLVAKEGGYVLLEPQPTASQAWCVPLPSVCP